MRKYSYLPITEEDIREAIESASKDKRRRNDVKAVLEDMDTYIGNVKKHIDDGTWKNLIKFSQSEKTGNNGKLRKLDTPNFDTLILEHVFINKVMPIYRKHDPLVSLNCKKGCGILQSKKKAEKSHYVLPRIKHLFYDLREYEWLVSADQRKCYEHIKPSIFRKELKKIISDKTMIDFAMGVCFNDGNLPIGAPSSSLVHHIMMLDFHRWLCRNGGWRLCYADNCIAAFRTKEEAQQMKWRIKQYWWYELKLRAKRSETRVLPISDARGFDFCGYRIFRNMSNLKQERMIGITQRNKGYCLPRKSIMKRASECRKDTSWASYFGLLRKSDCYHKMVKIESCMKLKDLTSKIKIDRTMDAKNIKASELAKIGQVFTIYDYEIRNSEKTGKPNWIKCLIGIPETDKNGELTGKTKAYEFHGGMLSIVEYMKKVEDAFGKKNLLPIEEVSISDQCGYIFTDSTNQKEYIE